MFKLILSLAIAVVLVGCSGNTTQKQCETIGLDNKITVEVSNGTITIDNLSAKSTDSELYFYIPNHPSEQMRASIPDGSLIVDGKEFKNLWVFIDCDVFGNWYMQILRGDGNLSMSVGADIVVKQFSVTF